MSRNVDAQLHGWLLRITRVHAYLCQVVRLYGKDRPEQITGDEYRRRVTASDRRIVEDACRACGDELYDLADAIQDAERPAPPSDAVPGTPEKVRVLRRRARNGQALFVAGDRRQDLR